jgi:hypothetical protein
MIGFGVKEIFFISKEPAGRKLTPARFFFII